MATAPSLPFLPVGEYLSKQWEPQCEYLDGVLRAKTVPDRIHNRLQKLLLLLLAQQETRLGLDALPELHLRVSNTRWRIPDISVLGVDPADGRYPDQSTPPLFTVEIVSQGEPWLDLRDKVNDHLTMGVYTVIIADPYNKTVTVATQTERFHDIAPPLIVNIDVPGRGGLQIDFDELFGKL